MRSSTFSSKPAAWFKTKVFSLFSLILFSFLLVGCGGADYNDPNLDTRTFKQLNEFTFGSYDIKPAYIDGINFDVDIAVHYNITSNNDNFTNEAPNVTHNGKDYSPKGAVDFRTSTPKIYTIIAQDGSTQNYDVTIRRGFVVSDATQLATAISTIKSDIAAGKPISYITIFVTQDIELLATDNITIPYAWAGKNIRLESNSTSYVTIKNITIEGDPHTVERIRVYIVPPTTTTCTPPTICNSTDFNKSIRDNLDGTYTLDDDIDLSGYANWEPIGNESNPFTGKLYGNGHTIKGLKFTNSNAKHIGLFGYIKGAYIENLKVEVANNSPVELNLGNDNQSFGVLAGYSNGAHILRVTVSSSPDTPLVINKSGYGSAYACNLYVGGIVGYLHGGASTSSALIERSASLISLNAKNTDCGFQPAYVGGIAGYSEWFATIDNSYSTGDISAIGNDVAAGGILGQGNAVPNKINKSYASGAISASDGINGAYAGGIAGKTKAGAISNSAALNPSVAVGGSGNAHRIGNDLTATSSTPKYYYINNIALDNISVRRNGGRDDNDQFANNANGQGGANKVLADLQKQATYNALGWDFNTIWYWNYVTNRPELY